MVGRFRNPWGVQLHEIKSRFYANGDDTVKVESPKKVFLARKKKAVGIIKDVKSEFEFAKEKVIIQKSQIPSDVPHDNAWHNWRRSLKDKGV